MLEAYEEGVWALRVQVPNGLSFGLFACCRSRLDVFAPVADQFREPLVDGEFFVVSLNDSQMGREVECQLGALYRVVVGQLVDDAE